MKKLEKNKILTNVNPEDRKAPDVAVLGAAAVDWVARVDEMPQLDGISIAEEYISTPGGSGGNVAESLAKMGYNVRFLGVLGDDEGGRMLMQAFMSAGVDTSCIRIERGQRSAACFIVIDRHGQRMIFSLGGVALYDRDVDIQDSYITGVKILFIADAFPAVAKTAISRLDPGSRVVFNPGGLMIASGIENLNPILECSDILIVSRVESEKLTGIPNPEEACQVLIESGPKAVLLTLGERGVLVVEKKSSILVPAISVEHVIDTTGAGDAFSAGVITGLLQGLSLDQAACLGCRVAARKIQFFGSRNGLPDQAQIRCWLLNETTSLLHERLES